MRRPVVDFLNHGVLPFAGRREETARLLSFATAENEFAGLRALLLSGEAGSGKSRIIDEVIPAIEAAGVIVVRARLRPDSAVSPAPLLSLALWSSASAGPLLREEPGADLPSVIGAVRRLSRLRRTLLIVEDAHLLEGAGVREFGLFVEALAEESLALLVASRPVELTARGAIEAYLVEEITLSPLDADDIRSLWSDLFGGVRDATVIDLLQEATLGNPLAFRSALRGAMNAGIIVGNGEEWDVVVTPSAFREMAERSARRLTEGMAAHLTEEERRGAGILASLGEAFAPEAAAILLPDGGKMVASLLFKGILVRSNSAVASLRDPAVRGLPMVFAHSLLHRTLLEEAPPDVRTLVEVIASDVPLFSITPFLQLEEREEIPPLPLDLIDRLVEAATPIVYRLDKTTDWPLTLRIWNVVERIVAAAAAGNEDAARMERIAVETLVTRTGMLARDDEAEEYVDAAREILRRTEACTEEWQQRLHLRGLLHLFRAMSRRDRSQCPGILERAEAHVEAYPYLRTGREYMVFLRVVSSCAHVFGLYLDDIRYAERSLERAMAESGNDAATRERWLRDIGYHLLTGFVTPEEYARRAELLALLRRVDTDRPQTYIREIAFLMETGAVREALPLIEKRKTALRELGLQRTLYTLLQYECEALMAIDTPFAKVMEKAEALMAIYPSATYDLRCAHLGAHLAALSAMRGRYDEIETITAATRITAADFPRTVALLRALERNEPFAEYALPLPPLPPLTWNLDNPDTDFMEALPLVKRIADGAIPNDEEIAYVRRLFGEPVIRRYRIITLGMVLALLDHLRENDPSRDDEDTAAAIRAGLNAALAWLAERDTPAFALPLLARHGARLSAEDQARWRDTFAARNVEALHDARDRRIALTMFGAVTIRRPGGETERLRGARNHLMLGLLVADAMLKVPLTRNAFVALASGVSDDPERARRAMNMAVLRLREAVGNDIVLTDQEKPRLNADAVTVDVVEARELLTQADLHVRRRQLTRGVELLRRVFDISGGDVPFPGLYDELFENVRKEFEEDLLEVTEALAGRLLEEGDYEHALDLLNAASDVFPDAPSVEGLRERALDGARGFEGVVEMNRVQ